MVALDRPVDRLPQRPQLAVASVGLAVVDPETGARREIHTQSRRVRARYATAAQQQRDDIAQAFRESRTAHLQLSTDRDWLHDFVQFVARQKGIA